MGIEAILGAVFGVGFIVVGAMQIGAPNRFLGPKAPWWMRSQRLRDPVILRMNGAIAVLVGALLLGSVTYLALT